MSSSVGGHTQWLVPVVMCQGSVGSGVGHTYNLLNCKQLLVLINDSQIKKTSI